MSYKVAYIGNDTDFFEGLKKANSSFAISKYKAPFEVILQISNYDLLIYQETEADYDTVILSGLIQSVLTARKVIFVVRKTNPAKEYLSMGVHDVYESNSSPQQMFKRFEFIRSNYEQLSKPVREAIIPYKLPLWKRTFDILFAGTVLIVLFPAFAVIALAIRLESKGKFYYAAPRIGTGYKVFGFLKFRSMYADADKRVDAHPIS